MNAQKTTCPYCGVGCGLLVNSDGSLQGDPDHPANFGRLCSKGSALGETLDLDGRLLVPRIAGAQATWDTALDLVAQKFSAAIRDHGPDSVAFYVSGQLLTEDYYVANKLMKGFIGSANIDTNSRLCMASSVAGHKRAFGTDTVPGTYADLDLADVIVLTGSNLAWCHPVLHQRILAAKSARPNLKIITIDPRRTASTTTADLHLAIRPDGDTALFNGLLVEIARRGMVNRAYIADHVNGFEDALRMAHTGDPANTGLPDEQLQAFYDLWIGSEKVVTIYSQGVNQSVGGSDKVNAIINCHLATGRLGRAGMGPFSVTGQPNAMGGREVGGLANMLACHLDIENPEHRDCVQQVWQSPTICQKPGLKAVDLFQACGRGDIKALWIIGTNPAVSMPDADAVSQAIKAVDFTVTSEVMTKTDTSVLTDVQLPAIAWGEKTGTVTNSERRISLQRGFLPAPGEARPDWEIICDVAQRMGWVDAFSYAAPADIFREYARLSGRAAALGRDFDISGLADISNAEYDDFMPVQWPVPKDRTADNRFFGQGKFFHADGCAKMLPVKNLETSKPLAGIFHLNTGRVRDHWHTMTRTEKSARLSQHIYEPFAEIHPDDATNAGLKTGGLVKIKTPTGQSIVRTTITAGTPRGTLFIPMHWSNANAPTGRVNDLTDNSTDPVSGQPALKHSRVELQGFNVSWYGFAASAAPTAADTEYWATARTTTGWHCEIAGVSQVTDWEKQARKVLGLSTGNSSVMYDVRKGTARIAIHEGAILKGVFFAAPDPVQVARALAISQIGNAVPALRALAGATPADQPDPGPIVCACFDVGANTLLAAIEFGSNTLAELGKCTSAGTNCGSCKSEIQSMIDATQVKTAAE